MKPQLETTTRCAISTCIHACRPPSGGGPMARREGVMEREERTFEREGCFSRVEGSVGGLGSSSSSS